MEIMCVAPEQLMDKFAEVVPMNYSGFDIGYPYTFMVYIFNEFPIRIKSKISKEEFDRLSIEV
jgi:hypothetical protein